MKAVKHTVHHVFIHISLFTACALLIPVVSAWLNKESLSSSAGIITASVLLIVVCVVMMYNMKESVPEVLRSFGAMIFLPGMLNVLFSVFSVDDFFRSNHNMTGMAVLQPVAHFYIEHSVPSVLSVAAVYMAIGGVLYYTGCLFDKAKKKLSWEE